MNKGAIVYGVTFQIRNTANLVGVFSSHAKAMAAAESGFVADLLLCGAIEYGAKSETMRVHKAITSRLGTDDLVFRVRRPGNGDETWVDAETKDGEMLQAAIITITRIRLDDRGAELGGEPVTFVHDAPALTQ